MHRTGFACVRRWVCLSSAAPSAPTLESFPYEAGPVERLDRPRAASVPPPRPSAPPAASAWPSPTHLIPCRPNRVGGPSLTRRNLARLLCSQPFSIAAPAAAAAPGCHPALLDPSQGPPRFQPPPVSASAVAIAVAVAIPLLLLLLLLPPLPTRIGLVRHHPFNQRRCHWHPRSPIEHAFKNFLSPLLFDQLPSPTPSFSLAPRQAGGRKPVTATL